MLIFVKIVLCKKNNLYNNITLLGSNFAFSQEADPILIFSGRVTDPYGKKLDGVQVIVTKDNQPFKQAMTSEVNTPLKPHLVLSIQ